MDAISGAWPPWRQREGRDAGDPWRQRMLRAAERLRLLDERRFQNEIARIHECLQRDATWNLETALACCDRWRSNAPAAE